MTPKDKHTEVAWQAKQREVKTGSVEKTVHSATSAIYTASEIRSVMSHSETQEITGNHITREQQLQNMRLATQKYLQPENQVNTQSILPENTGHTEQAAVQPEILWYKNESNYVPEQPVYNGSSEKYEAKAAQFHAPVSETYKIPEKPDRQVAREQQLKSIRLATQKYVQTEAGRSHAEEKQQTKDKLNKLMAEEERLTVQYQTESYEETLAYLKSASKNGKPDLEEMWKFLQSTYSPELKNSVSPSTGNSAPSEESTDDVEENSETEETSSTVPEQKISHYDSNDLEFLAD